MDFERTILTAAQQNAENSRKKEIKYYSTKFEPPKKLERKKSLSANIQRFLAKKEEEERQKACEAKERRDKLLELRSKDKKATRRVNVMLKRTKSANQSAIQDAVNNDNTSVTLAGAAGASQPDEDDYGYVSQSAADFYNKMMEKYNSMPDEPKYDFSKKKVNTNLSSTKDRVRSALDREAEEAAGPHRRKRKHATENNEENVDDKKDRDDSVPYKEKEKTKLKIKAAPVINFNDLLKIAEKKQHEPIKVEVKKDKEEERLLTKKQKREQEKDRELREQREKREKDRAMGITTHLQAQPSKNGKTTNDAKTSLTDKKIPKLNGTVDKKPSTSNGNVNTNGNVNGSMKRREENATTANSRTKPVPNQSKCDISNNKRPELSRNHANTTKSTSTASSAKPTNREQPHDMKGRPRDLKPKQFPPNDLKPRQFPPHDVRRPPMNMGMKRRPMPVKGRIYDDDDEEYDSEMDDFIDDGPEGEEDYSKHIREMFGYDKRKYQYAEDDDDNMESTFAQQMREESVSTKIGIMEDMEELRKEEEHNRRKAVMKKGIK